MTLCIVTLFTFWGHVRPHFLRSSGHHSLTLPTAKQNKQVASRPGSERSTTRRVSCPFFYAASLHPSSPRPEPATSRTTTKPPTSDVDPDSILPVVAPSSHLPTKPKPSSKPCSYCSSSSSSSSPDTAPTAPSDPRPRQGPAALRTARRTTSGTTVHASTEKASFSCTYQTQRQWGRR